MLEMIVINVHNSELPTYPGVTKVPLLLWGWTQSRMPNRVRQHGQSERGLLGTSSAGQQAVYTR